MKKILLFLLILSIFSCGKNNPEKIKAKQLKEDLKKIEGRLKTEEEIEKKLMSINTSGYDDTKILSNNDVKNLKKEITTKFGKVDLTAITNDCRAFIIKDVESGNKKEQVKSIIEVNPRMIETITNFCKSKGVDYRIIHTKFYDIKTKEKIISYSYYTETLVVDEIDKNYAKIFDETSEKYKESTKN